RLGHGRLLADAAIALSRSGAAALHAAAPQRVASAAGDPRARRRLRAAAEKPADEGRRLPHRYGRAAPQLRAEGGRDPQSARRSPAQAVADPSLAPDFVTRRRPRSKRAGHRLAEMSARCDKAEVPPLAPDS